MTSYKNFSKKSRKVKDFAYHDFDNENSYDPIKEENIDIEEWVQFISYYRYYIDEFATDILGIKLYPFQKLILRCMGLYKESIFIASRGIGKSFLSAVFFICVAVLWPGVKLGIASGKGQQARNVIIQKIKGELWVDNENIRREIANIKTGSDDCSVIFKNGSEIRAIVLGADGENARSWRFNQILIDEARLVRDSIISEILSPMTKTRRKAMINLSMKYGDKLPIEKGKLIYISSAYLKTCDLYQRFLEHFKHMSTGSDEYFVCTLPYSVGVNAGIFYEDEIIKEKNKPSMTSDKFSYEYEAKFVGSSNESFYPYELTEACRSLQKCELQQSKKSIVSYVISHDVALSDNKESDNACTTIIKLKEKPNGSYIKDIVFIKTHRGATLSEQRDYIRQCMVRFPNVIKLIIDVRGNGQALPSLFDEVWEYKNEKGEMVELPPLAPDDDEERMNLKNAIPIIRRVNATQIYNNIMHTYLKQCFEEKTIKLLISSAEVDMAYKNGEMTADEYLNYVNTDLLIQELSNIRQTISGHNNVIYDRIVKTAKRDRVTSLGYGMEFIRELEEENKLNIRDENYNVEDYLIIN